MPAPTHPAEALPWWLTSLLLLLLLGVLPLAMSAVRAAGDDLEDHSGESAEAVALEQQLAEADARVALHEAAQRACGWNAGAQLLPDGAHVRCTDKRGRLLGVREVVL